MTRRNRSINTWDDTDMIETVERFKTYDGQLHETQEGAAAHVVTSLENLVGPIVDQTKLGIKTRLSVVDALVGSVEKAKRLKVILDSFLD